MKVDAVTFSRAGGEIHVPQVAAVHAEAEGEVRLKCNGFRYKREKNGELVARFHLFVRQESSQLEPDLSLALHVLHLGHVLDLVDLAVGSKPAGSEARTAGTAVSNGGL